MSMDLSGYSPRMPRASWEGWFFIAIGSRDSEIRWTKTHVFRARRNYPLAAVEGLVSPGEVVTLIGLRDRIVEVRQTFAKEDLHCDDVPFQLALGQTLRWSAKSDTFSFSRKTHNPELTLNLSGRLHDRLQWAKFPGFLNYFGIHAEVKGTLRFDAMEHGFRGLGIMEHAWGASLPVHPARFITGPWHWDVLSFDTENPGPPPAAASLWIPIPGMGTKAVRAFARWPGGPLRRVRARPVHYVETRSERGRIVPVRWKTVLDDGEGYLEYEALASTPPAFEAPGGAFMGFTFNAAYFPKIGTPREWKGNGFTEFGAR